jgi:hypothetical protein
MKHMKSHVPLAQSAPRECKVNLMQICGFAARPKRFQTMYVPVTM